MNLARVVVVGTSCSGKSTLARRLASLLDSPCVELDSLHWGPGWTPRPDFKEAVLAVAERSRWVIDGNYADVRDAIWRRCTTIVWLDYSFGRVLAQALRRTARRIVSGERLYGDNRETVGNALFDLEAPVWLVVRTHRKRRRQLPALFKRSGYGHADVIQLQTPAAAEAFLTRAAS